LKQKDKIEDER